MSNNILFIVEGDSDEILLKGVLSSILDTEVSFEVTEGDITTNKRYEMYRGSELILKYFEDQGKSIKLYDYSLIVMITDTDGCYIPDDAIYYSSELSETQYYGDCIKGKTGSDLKYRNKLKRMQFDSLLYCCDTVEDVPFEIYYNSTNLDHVYHYKRNLPWRKKKKLAKDFFKSCNGIDYLKFISDNKLCVSYDYSKTWEHLNYRFNSLYRRSNFYLFFTRHPEILKDSLRKVNNISRDSAVKMNII